MTARLVAVVAGLSVVAAILPVRAHHSFAAEFDANKPVKLTGAVTLVEWMNPHAYFYMDVKDENGNVANWALEMGSINGLMRAGWTRHTLKVGEVVTVEGGRAKNGKNLANARIVLLASTGQRLFAASSQGSSPEPAK